MELKEEWLELHRRTGLPQTQILNRLIKFILEQDQPTQAMILQTLEKTDDLIELVLRRNRRTGIIKQAHEPERKQAAKPRRSRDHQD